MRVLLLNDTVDLENWGAQAGADALKAIVMEHIPSVEIKSLTYKWISQKFLVRTPLFGKKVIPLEKKSLIDRFSKEFQFLPLVADEFEFIARCWLDGLGGPQASEFINSLSGIDVIILNAEGSTYRNNFTAIKSLFLLWFAKTKFNIPAFFLNGSVTLTHVDPILPAMVNKTFSVLNGVTVREPYSFRNLMDFYPDISASLIPDTVFYLTCEEIFSRTSEKFLEFKRNLDNKPYVCFSIPILLSKIKNYYRQPLDFSPLVRTITKIQEIVPNVVIMSKEPNEAFLFKVAEDTGSFYFGPEYSYADCIALLNDAQFLLSGRYHHLIFSTLVGCPAIPLTSSSHKIQGLCELLGDAIEVSPIDSTDLFSNQQKITQLAQSICNNRDLYQRKIKNKAKLLYEQTNSLGLIIKRGF